ncbi:hypothetical protein PFMALIP_01792 [Plasmodium falciparum MaliPS096_E11]|uniref:Uncharacterized protein n=1 Tax=Plasmodium falciparum MaliPS096_E11 TaxID=1036727 RepID=A0A024WUC1_PLAFA|nr:hypothetical protein PFMALIP_01792 [Plasmodium falciparum MaliPS096_E11]
MEEKNAGENSQIKYSFSENMRKKSSKNSFFSLGSKRMSRFYGTTSSSKKTLDEYENTFFDETLLLNRLNKKKNDGIYDIGCMYMNNEDVSVKGSKDLFDSIKKKKKKNGKNVKKNKKFRKDKCERI